MPDRNEPRHYWGSLDPRYSPRHDQRQETFAEFLESPERIATNVLTDRLTLIEDAGLAKRNAYQERPKRYEYELTEKGRDLLPVMQNICLWANKHYPRTWIAPHSFMKKHRF